MLLSLELCFMDMTTIMLHTRQEGARRHLELCQHTFRVMQMIHYQHRWGASSDTAIVEGKSSMDVMPMHTSCGGIWAMSQAKKAKQHIWW